MELYKGKMKDFLKKLSSEYQKENKYDKKIHKEILKCENKYGFDCFVTNLSVIDLNLEFESLSLLKIKMSAN
tara:strand:+ start:499 stop:714 length:216 start_codon:yes stop_codon:yes gene_type:complete